MRLCNVLDHDHRISIESDVNVETCDNATRMTIVVVVGYKNKLGGVSGNGICVFYYQHVNRGKIQ